MHHIRMLCAALAGALLLSACDSEDTEHTAAAAGDASIRQSDSKTVIRAGDVVVELPKDN